MPLVTTEGLILQAFSYSDTSKILRLLTPGHGVRSVIAKGALRPRSRYGGVLEPFTTGRASFYVKEGRELQTLSEFELARPRQALGRDLVRFGAACLLAELVLRTGSTESDPALYDGLTRALDRLESVDEDELEPVALAEAWRLIAHLGFAPSLQACVVCGRGLAAAEGTYFEYASGGVHCQDCGGSQAGRELPARARADLAELTTGRPVPLERTAPHWQLLSRYLAYHLVDLRSLRSLTFLSETLARG